MTLLYSFIAIFIAWIWVDYYRLIDIYEKDRLRYFIAAFLLGGASVLIVIGLNELVFTDDLFYLNGEPLNDFMYSFLNIGAIEEFAKLAAFGACYLLFRKQFDEPIDYIAFISTCALGFSAVENVMYFSNHGPGLINARAILASVGHMFDTALIGYGIILHKYKNKDKSIILLYFLFAALSHGFYDYWLIHEGSQSYGWIITIIYFLITISWFAVILNNALNNSSFFTYKKIIDAKKVVKRLLQYYAIVFLVQTILLAAMFDLKYSLINLKIHLFSTGFIIVVTVYRLSRFHLIKGHWEQLKFELPFSIGKRDPYSDKGSMTFVRIKGNSINDGLINVFYEEYFHLEPLSPRRSYLKNTKLSFIERKLFLRNGKTYYLARVYQEDESSDFEHVIISPKTDGTTLSRGLHPIVEVCKIVNSDLLNDHWILKEDVQFIEWGIALKI